MSGLLALAERVEAAEGPDKALDAEIAVGAAGWRYQPHVGHNFKWHNGQFDVPGPPPRYTASLDAAMSLVPEGSGMQLDRYWIASVDGPVWSAHIQTGGVPENPRQVFEAWDAKNAALALTSAALRASATSHPEQAGSHNGLPPA